jgi:hypothetical protein
MVAFGNKDVDFFNIIGAAPWTSFTKRDVLDKKLPFVVWVEDTDFYVGAKDDDYLMKGQISITNPSAGWVDFGENIELSGFLNTGASKFPIFYGNDRIRLIDYTNMSVKATINYGTEAAGVDGIPNTNYIFLAVWDNDNIFIIDHTD